MTNNKERPLERKKSITPEHGALQLIFSQSPLPMCIYDSETLKIVEGNDAIIDLLGYERTEFMNLNVRDLFHKSEIPLLLVDLKRKPDLNLSIGNRHIRRKNGGLLSVELTTQVFVSMDGGSSILLIAKQIAVMDRVTTPREKNQLRHAVLENLRGVIIFSLDLQYHYVAFTVSHKEVMKTIWRADIKIGMNMLDCIHREDDRKKARDNFDRALLGEHFTAEEEYGSDEDNQRTWWENRYSPVYDLDRRIVGLTVFVIDITHRRQAEGALRINEARLRTITENAPDLIAELDHQRCILFLNRVLPGFKMDEVIGQDLCNWVPVEDRPILCEAVEQAFLTGEPKEYEAQGLGAYAEMRWYMTRISPVIVEGRVSSVVLISRDITERKKTEYEVLSAKEAVESINTALQKAFEHEQIASRTDNLTNVHNRRHFFEFIEYEFSISRRYQLPVSVILFDVDNFKQINDTHGHLVGDAVLVAVAQMVREELRESDVLARFGGDEFIILVSNNSAISVSSLVERIRKKIEASSIEVQGQSLKVTVSVGVADVQPPQMGTPTQLVHRADQALYSAKQGGRNRVAYSSNVVG